VGTSVRFASERAKASSEWKSWPSAHKAADRYRRHRRARLNPPESAAAWEERNTWYTRRHSDNARWIGLDIGHCREQRFDRMLTTSAGHAQSIPDATISNLLSQLTSSDWTVREASFTRC
jgi:hypothetical protein